MGHERPGLAQREHQATRLVALSFDSAASPHFTLTNQQRPLRRRAFGWGFAWYPEQGGAALVVKDATSVGDDAMTKLLRDWDRFESTTFIAHLRGATRVVQERDTHPFSRAYGGRDWVFAHNGDLHRVDGAVDLSQALPLGDDPIFEPIGRTDSEHAFCWLLTQIRSVGARCLQDIGWERLHGWFGELDALGTANIILSDGRDLVAYCDAEAYNTLHTVRFVPPDLPRQLRGQEFIVGLEDARDRYRTVMVISTEPMKAQGSRPMAPGSMIVLRRGAVMHEASPPNGPAAPAPAAPPPEPAASVAPRVPVSVVVPSGYHYDRSIGQGRLLSIVHETRYQYETPVERSSHLFRLEPVHDRWQDLVDHSLTVSVDGTHFPYQDVFGNTALRVEIDQPFSELIVRAQSLVRVRSDTTDDLGSPHRRFQIPLVWMPWQRQMMTPYLLPPELPETQLRELSDYAMSFVERQDYDLVQTLLDMNRTIYQDYRYVSGSTNIATTPFDVYVRREGVCQDFANLFICMARLLGIPARYRVGYIYTGNDYENQVQSDASHAWTELYLPWAGWQGFDPTNGVLVNRDHIRTAAGRNYVDAAPTSGTLYKGGVGEKLTVEVRVEEAVPQDAPVSTPAPA